MSTLVQAAGAVLWRRDPQEDVEVAVVHRPHYDDWSLPKGKLDPGETKPVAAVRELAEETGFGATLGRFLMSVGYDVNGKPKTVDYFSAQAHSGQFEPNEEVDELRWLPPADAKALLSYDTDVSVVDEFLSWPADLITLLLVRHAKAGNRADWTGDDDLRPLSDAGMRQAQALRVTLRAFGPDRVLSAPRLRCVQTVQGLADDLGVEVQHEPLLSEEGYALDRLAGIDRLLTIVAENGTPVLCSQGGVIPGLVTELAERSGLPLPPVASRGVPSKKGSLWSLSFTPAAHTTQPQLVAVHYLPSPLPAPAPAIQ